MNRTVPVSNARDAERIRARIEEPIRDVELARLEIPDGVKAAEFLVSGGKVSIPSRPEPAGATTLGELLAAYESAPPPHLDPSTIRMQAIHAHRILKIAEASTPLPAFDPQGYYVAKRVLAIYRAQHQPRHDC